MKILTFNTHSLVEKDYETKLLQFAEMAAVEQPEIMGLQEVNQRRDASALPDLKAGDEVILLGEEQGVSITVPEMAAMRKTIEHEVTCDISLRVPRVYIR